MSGLFQPAYGSPELAEIQGRLAKLHSEVREMNKRLEFLDGRVWEMWKREEGNDPIHTDYGSTR